jgi:hypothetical protein
VVKEALKKERSKGKKSIEREDQGGHRIKEDRSWTSQQAEEDTNGCFGPPHREEGRIGRRSPEKASYVDLGFWYLGF